VHWGNEGAFPPPSLTTPLKNSNKTLIIFWDSMDYTALTTNQPRFSMDAIIRGDWDNYIKSFAASAKAYGGSVILIPFEEANGNWSPWSGTLNGNTPAKVMEAYRHIHDVFGNVPNVKWALALNSNSVPDTTANALELYYPGDNYVDYMGIDGFNFGSPWLSFSQIFDKTLATLKRFNKPIWIFSLATAEGSGKAAWISDAITVQIPKHSEIVGWVWFNEAKEQNWLVWSSDAALTAFKNAVK
jgi:beta-mannanase